MIGRSMRVGFLRLFVALSLVAVTLAVGGGSAQADDGGPSLQSAVMLVGEEGGDADGSGAANISFYAVGWMCFSVSVSGIGDVTAAHIHTGGAGETGPVLINLGVDTNGLTGCVAFEPGADLQVIGDPNSYYLNVHTSEYPGGAIRGQLGLTTKGDPTFIQGFDLMASGDPDGGGFGTLLIGAADGLVCSTLAPTGIGTVTAAHIHVGEAGSNGPVAVPLGTTLGIDAVTCAHSDADLGAIVANPAGYYVNVHTEEYPGGAVRGQLGGAGVQPPEPPAPVPPPPAPAPDPAPAYPSASSAPAAPAVAVAAGVATTGIVLDLPPVNGLNRPNATISVTGEKAGELAFTGPTTPWLAHGGLALLAVGFAAMAAAGTRRRSQS